MGIDFVAIAGQVVTLLSPFMPFLMKIGQSSAEAFAKTIAEHGGDAIWDRAQQVWSKLTKHYGGDPTVTGASMAVASAPQEESFRTLLAAQLAKRLEANPELAEELQSLLGGQEAVQTMRGGAGAWLVAVEQIMSGLGKQEMQVGDHGMIWGAKQHMSGSDRPERPHTKQAQ